MGCDGPNRLSERRRRFVEAYLLTGRPKAAAIAAGYAERSAAKTAWRLLAHPVVAAVIRAAQDERARRLSVSADRIVREHARIAFSNIRTLVWFDGNDVRVRDDFDAASADATAAVRGLARRGRDFSLRLYDKPRSLAVLGAVLGLAPRPATGAPAAAATARAAEHQSRFADRVAAVRARLQLSPDAAAVDVLAEGVARGDPGALETAAALGLTDPPPSGSGQ